MLTLRKTNNDQDGIREVRLLSDGFLPQTAIRLLGQRKQNEALYEP
jgi:hypothetical protein